ncbi:hypothetical protein CB1_002213001 [Camelus ferus]|nr:hypothetical protein CB1_002213001 [Camelus ferus]
MTDRTDLNQGSEIRILLVLSEHSDVDQDTALAGAQGFLGCLSAVQLSHVAPLKAALHPSRPAPITVSGHVTESSCVAQAGTDATSRERTHSFAGLIAVVIFILLCIAAIAVRIYQQKRLYQRNEAKRSENVDSAEAVLKNGLALVVESTATVVALKTLQPGISSLLRTACNEDFNVLAVTVVETREMQLHIITKKLHPHRRGHSRCSSDDSAGILAVAAEVGTAVVVTELRLPPGKQQLLCTEDLF